MCANALCQKTLRYGKRPGCVHSYLPTPCGGGGCGVRPLPYRVLHDDGGVCDENQTRGGGSEEKRKKEKLRTLDGYAEGLHPGDRDGRCRPVAGRATTRKPQAGRTQDRGASLCSLLLCFLLSTSADTYVDVGR